MKNIPPSLAAYLPTADAAVLAGCFTITLLDGSVSYWTDWEQDLVLARPDGTTRTYAGGGPGAGNLGITGLKLDQAIGLDAKESQVTFNYRAISDPFGPSTIEGQPLATALWKGVFDKAIFTWGIATLSAMPGAAPVQPVGWGDTCPDGTIFDGVAIVFQGRLGQAKNVGAVSADLSIKSDLVVLEQPMPHRCFQPSCVHTLYDEGCGLAKGDFTTIGTVGSGSTRTGIVWGGAVPDSYTKGTILFTSGVNSGLMATIALSGSGVLQLAYPLQVPSNPGDSFAAAFGCDKSMGTCTGRFGNIKNFLGFPYIPPPEAAI